MQKKHYIIIIIILLIVMGSIYFYIKKQKDDKPREVVRLDDALEYNEFKTASPKEIFSSLIKEFDFISPLSSLNNRL